MSDPVRTTASSALRRLWRRPVPHDLAGPVAFAPSGERIAVGADGPGDGPSDPWAGSLTVFDTSTGDVVRQDTYDWQVSLLAFSPDSRWLATAESPHPTTHEYQVRILDVDTLVERCHYTGAMDGWAEILCFSRDGRWVAANMMPDDGSSPMVYVFDATNGTQRWRLPFPWSYFALSPDSGSVAVGCFQHGIAVLDATTGTELRRITPPSVVMTVAYSPDNHWIVAGCRDGVTRVFDTGTGRETWSARPSGRQPRRARDFSRRQR